MWDLVTLALTLVPALFAWAWSRRLVPLADDPALPERLVAYRGRLVQVTAVALAVAWFTGPAYAPWSAALGIGAVIVAGFPARRALQGETWGLPSYLWHVVRVTLAVAGFWMLLAVAPILVQAAGAARWPVAALLGVLLVTWNLNYPVIFLRLLRATPLDRPDLTPRFAAVLARASARPPRVHRAGTPGSRWANAFAFPAVPEPSVAFTDTLLERFKPDELAAIFAHEVAHLEHYDRRRLLRLSIVICVGIAVAVLGLPVLMHRFETWASLIAVAWVGAVALGLIVRAAHHKAHEAESDRRAVLLCGDPAALVRALVKLHLLMRLPRRWEVDFERGASHPSLAHRIHAIQSAAGVAAPPPGAAVAVAGRTAGGFVIFDADRLHRLEGVPAAVDGATPSAADGLLARARTVHTVAYAELTDLRVRTTLRGMPSLVGTDRTGRSWAVPLRPDGVAAAQAALDAVDVQLARVPLGFLHHPLLGTFLAGLVTALALWSATWVVVAPALVGLVRPVSAPLAATGATALAGALLSLRGPAPLLPLGNAGAVALGVAGGLALALAWARVRAGGDARPGPGLVTAAILGTVALAGGASLGWAGLGGGAVALSDAARSAPGTVAALLGVAATLAALPPPWARRAAVAAVGLAIVPLVLGSGWLRDRFADDPLRAPAAPLAWREASLRLVHQTRLGVHMAGLRLAGATYALFDAGSGTGAGAWRVSAAGGEGRRVEADELELLADGRLLAFVRTHDGPELRLLAADAGHGVLWRRRLADVPLHGLAVEPGSGAWRLLGPDPAGQRLVVLSGVAGDDGVRDARWPLPEGLGRGAALAVGGEAALGVRARWAEPDGSTWGSPWLAWAVLLRPGVTWEVWVVSAAEARRLFASRLMVRCLPPAGGSATFVCLAHEGERTLIWSVDGAGARAVVGAVPGDLPFQAHRVDGPLTMWSGLDAAVVDPGRRTALGLDLPAPPVELVFQDGRLGALSRDAQGVTVRVYEVGESP